MSNLRDIRLTDRFKNVWATVHLFGGGFTNNAIGGCPKVSLVFEIKNGKITIPDFHRLGASMYFTPDNGANPIGLASDMVYYVEQDGVVVPHKTYAEFVEVYSL